MDLFDPEFLATLTEPIPTRKWTPDMRRMVKPLKQVMDALEMLDEATVGAWRILVKEPLTVEPDDTQVLKNMAALGEAVSTTALQVLRLWHHLEPRMFTAEEQERGKQVTTGNNHEVALNE